MVSPRCFSALQLWLLRQIALAILNTQASQRAAQCTIAHGGYR